MSRFLFYNGNMVLSAERLAWIDALCFLKFNRLEDSLHEFVVEWLHALLEERPAEVA